MLRLAQAIPSHEELFLERYERLLSAASTLTAGDRETARELVHDAYIHFVLMRPPIESIQRIDGYLFIAVRNLSISRARRATRVRHEPIGLAEFDSAALGLLTLADAQRIEAVDQLQRICAFALERRWLARSASAFLLHYFHEYPPSQVARVLHTAPVNARKLLWLARAEVRSAFAGTKPIAMVPIDVGIAPDDVTALRQAIFRAAGGQCLPAGRLQTLYDGDAAVDVGTLAHLVACRTCLARVNTVLGLPPLDGNGADDGPDASGGTGAGMRRAHATTAFNPRQIGATREHRPKELRIAVNGLPIGMQRVAGADNEVVVRLGGNDVTMFVEVFSEQQVRLLLLNAEPLTCGVARQTARVALSDDRFIEAELDLTDVLPSLRVTYRDPAFAADGHRSAETDPCVAADGWSPPALPDRATSDRVLRPIGDAFRRVAETLRTRPRRRLFWLAGVSALVWLMLFPPAAVAATADRIYQHVVAVIDRAWHWLNPPAAAASLAPAPMPALRAERVAPLVAPSPTVARAEPGRPAPSPAFNGLELDAWYRAHLVGLVFGREVQVTPISPSTVRLDVRVGNEYRRAAILARLEAWSMPSLTVAVDPTTQESGWDSPPDAIALWVSAALRAHVTSQMPSADAEATARDSIGSLRRELDRQAASVTSLRVFLARWPLQDFDGASADSVTHWTTVVRDHALAIGETAEALRSLLSMSIGEDAVPDACAPQEPVVRVPDVTAAVAQLLAATDRLTPLLAMDADPALSAPLEAPLALARAVCEIEVAARAFAGPLSFNR